MLTYISVVQFGIDVFPSLASLLAIQKRHIDTGPLFHAEERLIWLTFLAIEAMLETIGFTLLCSNEDDRQVPHTNVLHFNDV
jgi:hypothetical protein